MRVSWRLGMLEVVMKSHFAFDRYLVRGDAAFEEVGELLHILKLHKSERVSRPKHGRHAERPQTAVGYVLQIFPHVGWRQTADTKTQDIVCECHFTFDRVFHHFSYPLFQILVEEIGLLPANGLND